MIGISHDAVEVDDSVEMARRSDPRVDRLAVGFTRGSGMVIRGAGVRQDSASDNFYPMSVLAHHHLLVHSDDALD